MGAAGRPPDPGFSGALTWIMVPFAVSGRRYRPMSTKNISHWDRIVRIAIGLAMLLAASTGAVEGVWRVGLLLFAWVPLVTGAFGWDPIYALLRIGSHRE